jgi:hypothetical protein
MLRNVTTELRLELLKALFVALEDVLASWQVGLDLLHRLQLIPLAELLIVPQTLLPMQRDILQERKAILLRAAA